MFTRFPGCLARGAPPQAGRAGGAQAGGIQFPRPQKKNGAPAGPQARWENKQSPASLGLAFGGVCGLGFFYPYI